jgi:phosphoglycerol transferase MdoB-like AlkP superfamily enzyme
MRAWVALALAVAAHVADEALTDFLSFYNPLVASVRDRVPWLPLPTFTFGIWLAGLILFVIILLALSVFVYDGRRWMIPLALGLSILMMANALGHAAASIYLSRPAPGVTSSPLLFLASAFLLRETLRARRRAGRPRQS